MLLTQERHGIDISVRTALKSASGNDYSNARYYDSAGYFFDAAFGRQFTLIPDKSDLSSRHGDFVLSIGHQVGFIDWPFHQFRFGISYIISRNKVTSGN